MSYEFDYRGYRIVFADDEQSAEIHLRGEQLHTVHDQGDITAMDAALRWVGEHRKGRIKPKEVAATAESHTKKGK